MPTYEYACRSCGQHLEVVQSFRDDPLTECPRCAGNLRKVFQPIGIAFKGSGFYKTDSRSSSAPKSDGKSADSKPAESKPAESKPTESKPAETKSTGSTKPSGSTSPSAA